MRSVKNQILVEESHHRFLSAIFKKNIKTPVLKSERLVAYTLRLLLLKEVSENLTLNLLIAENKKLLKLSEGTTEHNVAEAVYKFYSLLRDKDTDQVIPIHYNNYIGRGNILIKSFLVVHKSIHQLSKDFLALSEELLLEIQERFK